MRLKWLSSWLKLVQQSEQTADVTRRLSLALATGPIFSVLIR